MARFTLDWHGDRVERLILEAAADGLGQAAEVLLEESNRTVPHDEGILEASGSTDLDRSNLRASVFYDTPYAVRQHEDTRLRHRQGRRAKWLERTLVESADRLREHVATAIRRVTQ